MTDMKQVVGFYEDWYEGLTLPATLEEGDFGRFVASSVLVNEVVPDAFEVAPVSVENHPSGSTDGKQVYIPLWYFASGSFPQVDPSQARFLSFACLNGTLVHEYLHIKHSNNHFGVGINLRHWIQSHSGLYGLMVQTGERFVSKMVNVVEDIYIEGTVSGTVLRDVLQNKNEVILPTDALDEMNGQDELTAFDIMNALISMKNLNARTHEIYSRFPHLSQVAAMLLQADTGEANLTPTDRLNIAYQIVKYLADEFHNDGSDKAEGGDGNGQGQGSEGSEEGEKGNGLTENWGNFESVEGRVGRDNFDNESDKNHSAFVNALKVAKEFEKALLSKKLENKEAVVKTLAQAVSEQSLTGIRPKPLAKEGKIDMSMLVQSLRFRNKTNKLSAPTRSGPAIQANRLSRHRFDPNLFGHRTRVMRDDPEIIVVLDASGSMNEVVDESTREDLAGRTMAVGDALHKALGNIPHVIVSHTNDNHDPVIYMLAGHGMGYVSEFEHPFRLGNMLARRENADGLVLKKVSTMFTSKKGPKLLIVVSDGQPSCYTIGYQYEEALPHTQEIVSRIRKGGIHVIALSINKRAKDANDRIYGEDLNINIDPQGLAKEIERVIANIVK